MANKFPNPAFFRAKDHMDKALQKENSKEFIAIAKQLFRERDKKAMAERRKFHAADNARRSREGWL